MTKAEIETFIETMGNIGDKWTPEQVRDVYGDSTLKDAIAERQEMVNQLAGNIGKLLNC
jgi:hypothetical protein